MKKYVVSPDGTTRELTGPQVGVNGERLGSTGWNSQGFPWPAGQSPRLSDPAAQVTAVQAGMRAGVAVSAAGRVGTVTQSLDPDVIARAVQKGVEAALRGNGGLPGMSRSGGGSTGRPGPGPTGPHPSNSGHTAGHGGVPIVSGMRNTGGYGEGFIGGGGGLHNWRSLTSNVTSRVGEALSQAGRASWAPPVVEQKPVFDQLTGKRMPSAGPAKRVQGPDGNFHNVPIDPEKASKLKARGKFLDATTGALAGMGESGGALGGIAAAVPEIAAVAAIPGLAYEGASFIQKQRQANTAFQSIYGGSNMGGMGERFKGEMFRMGQIGTLSGAQAQEAFMGVSQLGMKGGERAGATNLIVDEYKKIGMSIKQGLEAVTIAAQTGNSALTGLAKGIDSVTKTAAANGVNANVARQNFISSYKAVGSMITGSQAPALAAGMAGAQANMGRTFQGQDLTGFQTPEAQRLIAAMNGRTLNQEVARTMGPGGAQANLEDQTSAIIRLTKSMGLYPILSEEAQRVLDDAKQGNREPVDNDWTQAVIRALPRLPGDVETISNAFQQFFNVPMDVSHILLYLIKTVAGTLPGSTGKDGKPVNGVNNPAAAAKAVIGESGSKAAVAGVAPGSDLTKLQSQSAQMKGQRTPAMQSLQAARDAAGTTNAGVFSSADSHRRRDDQNWYKNNVVTKLNEQDPILAELLKRAGAKDRFIVQSKGGKTREVDMRELETYYRDQVQAGTVTFANGPNAGTDVATFTDMTPAQSDVDKASGASGSAAKQTVGKVTSAGSGGGGRVVITASAELQRYLNIIPQAGNIAVSQSNASGVPPTTTPMPQASPGALNQ